MSLVAGFMDEIKNLKPIEPDFKEYFMVLLKENCCSAVRAALYIQRFA